MPLLSAREMHHLWAEGYWCGFICGLVVMGVVAIVGAWAAFWWLT